MIFKNYFIDSLIIIKHFNNLKTNQNEDHLSNRRRNR